MATNEHSEESIEFLKTVLSASPSLIGVLTKDGIFRYVNKVVEGLTFDKVIGASVFDFTSKEDIEPLKRHIADALRENKIVWYETRATGPNNTEAIYACSLSPFVYGGEQLIVSIGTDISGQKKTEKELQLKVKQLEILNESMMDREVKMVELKKKLEELGHKI